MPIAKAAESLQLDDLFASVNAHLERYVLVLLVRYKYVVPTEQRIARQRLVRYRWIRETIGY